MATPSEHSAARDRENRIRAKQCASGKCAYDNFACPNGCLETVELDLPAASIGDATATVYLDQGLLHLPGANPGTPYTICGLDAGLMERQERPVTWAGMWCTACMRAAATPAESPWKTASRERWDADYGEGDFDRRIAEEKKYECPRGHRHYEGSAFCTVCGAGPVLRA